MNALLDWLGAGGTPVSKELADSRANACLSGDYGKPCPEHRAAKWWEYAKSEIATAIRNQLSEKHKMNLRLAHEDEMMMCRACGCSMALKPWVPIEHVKENVRKDDLQKYPPWCWIRKEISGVIG